ncbi:TonB-dependent receptor plug domain-containing protein [Achromobacter aloeverae]|uniref:TonB-dependent receptor n=1 Tax=Achromobacter aloeverae TaxID=1750518 RepID=A0A4Q1HEP6_9BURK|nr:TonB-dependent receptor [Achromobacter aloeverae]RXN84651.1 TonB-dependent receptor [Achromobacter aloeverae]
MKSRFVLRNAGLLACLAPAWAWAQQTPATASTAPATASTAPAIPTTQLGTVVVTAARSEQALKDVLGDVTVIGSEELQNAGQSSLAEVLSRSHGIEYANNGGPQTVTSLFIRGANSNQTLVLVDGQRINNATNGLPALNALPASSIDHVEIVRGAASSLYGSDAIGGVINIITKRNTDKPLSAYADVGFGTYGTSSYNAGLSGASNGWTYSLSTGYQQSSGFDATTKKNYYHNPDKDSYYQNNVAASLGYEWLRGQTLSVQYYRSYVNGGYDMGAAPLFNDRAIQKLEDYSVTSTNRLTDFWTSTLRFGASVDYNRSENAPGDEVYGNTPDGRSVFRTRQTQLNWQHDLQLAPGQKLTLAYEHLEQRANGDIVNFNDYPVTVGNYEQSRRLVNSFTGVYLGDFGRHHVQASLRNDNNSQYGNRTTGGLTYGFDITDKVRATAGYNTGFRAPNFNELYWRNDSFFQGNPNLRPETSRNYELGLRYQDDDAEAGVTYYHNNVKNLIINQAVDPSNPFGVYQPYNIAHAVLEGVTFTGMRKFGDTRIRASLDLSNPRNTDTHQQLPQRSDTVLRLSADHRWGSFLLGGEVYLTDERRDATTGSTLGGYGLFNLLASYDVTRNVQVSVRWNNVFDKQYTLVDGYRTPGSNAFVNLRWRM